MNISLKSVPKGPISNIPALVLIMAWRRPGDKPLSEQMMFSLLTHICVTWPQWVNHHWFMWCDVLKHGHEPLTIKHIYFIIRKVKSFPYYQRTCTCSPIQLPFPMSGKCLWVLIDDKVHDSTSLPDSTEPLPEWNKCWPGIHILTQNILVHFQAHCLISNHKTNMNRIFLLSSGATDLRALCMIYSINYAKLFMFYCVL